VGVAIAAVSGVAFGVATVVARDLAHSGVAPETVLVVRFGLGALALGSVALIRGNSLMPARGERWAAALLGTALYSTQASLFFAAVERGSAGLATVLFYTYPAMVIGTEAMLARRMPQRTFLYAVILAAAGTVLVAVSGSEISFSAAVLVFALAAAALFCGYLVVSARYLAHTDRFVASCWVTGGASAGIALRGAVAGGLENPDGHWLELAVAGLATGLAFVALLAAVRSLGPARTAVVLNIEIVAAVGFGALLLGEDLGTVAVLGALAIFVAAAWVTSTEVRRAGLTRSD
jgi:drug/metabolite transporter (DMT)-like permease